MSEIKNVERRTVLKGAAWSVPVIAVAAATPLAAASVNNASIAWNGSTTALLGLHVLDTATVITANALVTVPTQYTVTNGAGALTGAATVTITVGQPSGINLTLGRARGFGVYSVDGVTTPAGERSFNYPNATFGFPNTTWTGTRNVTVASDGTLNVPVEFGLVGTHDLASIGLLGSFPVTLTVLLNGKTFTSSSTIDVPVGAGIL